MSLIVCCCVGMEMIYVARGRWELALRRLEDAESLVRVCVINYYRLLKLKFSPFIICGSKSFRNSEDKAHPSKVY